MKSFLLTPITRRFVMTLESTGSSTLCTNTANAVVLPVRDEKDVVFARLDTVPMDLLEVLLVHPGFAAILNVSSVTVKLGVLLSAYDGSAKVVLVSTSSIILRFFNKDVFVSHALDCAGRG